MAEHIRVLLTEEEVDKRIQEIGEQISKDYAGKQVHLVCVLKGGSFFMCELAKRITVPVSLDFMSVSSYGSDTKSSGVVKIVKDLDESLKDKEVIVVEDIVDSGRTLSYLLEMLKDRGPASLRLCEASNELFAQVVAEAHRRGMRVILDGVFNHCGSFNKWMDRERIYENAEGYDKGAYVSADSPYRNYFDFHNQAAWPYNNSYDGWWGHDTLPKLNYEGSQELMDYVLHVAKKWVSPPYNVDGWRLDVAADLGHSQEFNHHFWQEFRKAVKEANPEAIILAEHYGNTRDWLQGNEWDTVMNYDAFMEPVTWFLTGMEKHSDDYREDLLGNSESFWGAMRHHTSSFSMPSWQVAMNELSNHDHSRFLTRTNHKVGRTNTLGPQAAEQGINKAVFREGVVIQMTWTGAPTIYYGDEAGVCGFTDPDNRRTYPWGHEDQVLLAFHKDIIHLRRENEELRTGSLKMLIPITKEIHVWEIGTPKTGKMKVILQSRDDGYCMEGAEYEIRAGKVLIEMPQTSAT